MTCTRCHLPVGLFSSRCPHCTSEHTVNHLWWVNIVGTVLAVLAVLLLFTVPPLGIIMIIVLWCMKP